VTEGEGRVLSRGEPVVMIHPGDVIRTPGASTGTEPRPTTSWPHLSMSEGDAEWGEHVSDGKYQGWAAGVRAVGEVSWSDRGEDVEPPRLHNLRGGRGSTVRTRTRQVRPSG